MSEENKVINDPATEPTKEPEQGQAQDPGTDKTQAAEDTKQFTQAQIDAMVARAKEQARRQIFSNKEEEEQWAAYKAAQEAKKPEEQRIDELTRKLVAKETELETFKRKDLAIQKGIAPAYIDFAVFEIGRTLQEGDDFTAALETWIKANEHMLAGAQTEPKPAATGMRHQSAGKTIDGVEQAFLAKNPGLKLDD